MRLFGHVTYCLYCNFTNYGSALHTYALEKVVNSIAPGQVGSIVMNYCPDVLKDKDILNPVKNLWDSDDESRHMVELSMPSIRMNYEKFLNFYNRYYTLSKGKYTSSNFDQSLDKEGLSGYICGSDTIWCIREFNGFDDGFFGNYSSMKETNTFSYAASFGDVDFLPDELTILGSRMQNFKAISVREKVNIDFIRSAVPDDVNVQQVLDPTLLLKGDAYSDITEKRLYKEPYILLYARRYNKSMEAYAERLAREKGCIIVEISLRATNEEKGHIMRYDAGIEEFLSLTKHAEYVITNSFHGAIFGIQMHKPIRVFSREQADTKIEELLDLLGLTRYKMVTGEEEEPGNIDYDAVEDILAKKRVHSMNYLTKALGLS